MHTAAAGTVCEQGSGQSRALVCAGVSAAKEPHSQVHWRRELPHQHPRRTISPRGHLGSRATSPLGILHLPMPRLCWLLAASVALALLQTADSDLPVTHSNLQIDRATSLGSVQSADVAGDGGEESCGCEDDFPPGAGFAFRREGYAIVAIEGGKVARQRKFFENERVTFKEILAPGDGKNFPQVQL